MITLAGILLVTFESLGGIFFFTRKKSKKIEDEPDQEHDNLLCRFVTDGAGRKIGESVSLDEDILIIKSGDKFLGVPLKHIEEEGKTILVKGLVDFDKAYEMGEKWRKESFREINQKEKSEGKKDGF
ncbi:MAG: hypothetical protein KAQ84_00635 [Thermoplasmatales archaeon]|nr:hypothetical protein [Thermoplasmatales archaeon]MCK5261784.1 hypothetical protein [Thermoplasmatales archaeon]